MHAISSYRGNSPTNTPTNTHAHKHTNPQTGQITIHSTAKRSVIMSYCVCVYVDITVLVQDILTTLFLFFFLSKFYFFTDFDRIILIRCQYVQWIGGSVPSADSKADVIIIMRCTLHIGNIRGTRTILSKCTVIFGK